MAHRHQDKIPDLQYACVFPLPRHAIAPARRATATASAGSKPRIRSAQTPSPGAYGKIQYKAKGYPGIRELEVLRGIGEQGIVALICPADVNEGYRPAIEAVLDRIRWCRSEGDASRGRSPFARMAVSHAPYSKCSPPRKGAGASATTCVSRGGPSRRRFRASTEQVAGRSGVPCQMNELQGEDKVACLTNNSTG